MTAFGNGMQGGRYQCRRAHGKLNIALFYVETEPLFVRSAIVRATRCVASGSGWLITGIAHRYFYCLPLHAVS